MENKKEEVLRRTGKGGATIPVSSMANLILGMVRSYAARKRRLSRHKVPMGGNYRIQHELQLESLKELLYEMIGEVCALGDIDRLVTALYLLCNNSTWAKEQ